MAKIQHLLKLHLRRSEVLTDSGVYYLIRSSPNIKTILFGMTINRKIIKWLIKRAKKDPKIQYKLFYSSIIGNAVTGLTIPSNLFLKEDHWLWKGFNQTLESFFKIKSKANL